MITEAAFVGADNLPQCMAERLDVAWTFVGEVGNGFGRHVGRFMNVACNCLRKRVSFGTSMSSMSFDISIVSMERHLFITDDMLEVWVYFGVCPECGKVYWARSGPPFRRARACVECG